MVDGGKRLMFRDGPYSLIVKDVPEAKQEEEEEEDDDDAEAEVMMAFTKSTDKAHVILHIVSGCFEKRVVLILDIMNLTKK